MLLPSLDGDRRVYKRPVVAAPRRLSFGTVSTKVGGGRSVFQIGKLFHLTQVVDDLEVVDRWYDEVFAVERFYHGYEELAGRTASLIAGSTTPATACSTWSARS